MASGSPLETVDNLGAQDYANIYTAYQVGLCGPYKDYFLAYTLNPPIGKDKKPVPFEKLFQHIHELHELKGQKIRNARSNSDESIASAAAMSLGMPPEMLKQLTGGSDASS